MTDELLCTNNSSKNVNCFKTKQKNIDKLVAGGSTLCINDNVYNNLIC